MEDLPARNTRLSLSGEKNHDRIEYAGLEAILSSAFPV
jgi:hypothetical protein